MKDKKLFIVVPCYNEEEVLPETTRRLTDEIKVLIEKGLCSSESKILFIDDGSRDKTWNIIEEYTKENKFISGLKLAHNRGHQNALLAGLLYAKNNADMSISMDADLQDDINVCNLFLEKYDNEQCDIIFGARKSRETDTFLKKFTAEGYYKIMDKMGVDLVFNAADCRFMSARALYALSEYKEVNLFLRGIAKDIGLKTDIVYYDRAKRFAGKSKYPLKKMLALAWNGITSFSTKPLSLISVFGAILSCCAGISLIVGIILWCCGHFGGILCTIISLSAFFSGITILCVGIVGSYVGKTYFEAKARPRYVIEKMV